MGAIRTRRHPPLSLLAALALLVGSWAEGQQLDGQQLDGQQLDGHAASTIASDTPWVGQTPPPLRLAQSTEAVSRPAVFDPPPPTPARPAQRRLLQSINLSADWLPRMDDDSLGRSTLSASVGLGVPPVAFGLPLLVTPRAALHLVDGPDSIDTPSRLNEFDVSFGTFRKLNDCWSARGSVTVGVYGDDHSLDSSEALRVSGLALALYQASPEWTWAFGVAYLNRDDYSIIPAAGAIYDTGAVRYELMFPRPRVVWRLPQDELGSERSVYLAGELGGGAWAVQRDNGTTDTLNLSRWGVLLGYEAKEAPGVWLSGTRRYEFGYVFGRELEYANTGEQLTLDDSLVARVGWTY